jgi:hypothetical protein
LGEWRAASVSHPDRAPKPVQPSPFDNCRCGYCQLYLIALEAVRLSLFEVVVIGGGQAGLGVGYFLRAAGRNFVIFERGQVGDTWRAPRWAS